MSRGIFITGTDTGVGKTIVSAVIIRALLKKGIKVGAMKPIETGCIKIAGNNEYAEDKTQQETLLPSDGMFLKEMAGMDDPIDLITPDRLEHPLAPMVASDIEKRPIEIKKIMDAYGELSRRYDFMVVEGVGGLLVPILRRQKTEGKGQGVYFVTDLIRDLRLPAVVVVRPTLGTINHTLLTINHALKEGIDVLGVIINYHNPPSGDIAEKTNPDVLKELCPLPVIGIVPYIQGITLNSIDDAVGRLDINFLPKSSDKVCHSHSP